MERCKGCDKIKCCIDSIFLIVLQNNDYQNVIQQPFFSSFADQGTILTNSHGVTHPSQPNYFALTAGDTFNTTDAIVTLTVTNLVDLLEENDITWKSYVENYPGSCFTGAQNTCVKPATASSTECSSGIVYIRQHNPFISYYNIQMNPKRCAKIVNATELQKDIACNNVPQFALYIPNTLNGGMNTNIQYTDQYMQTTFIPLLRNPSFTKNRIFIITFDQSRNTFDTTNQIYTAFWGAHVKKNNVISTYANHYNLLRTIEQHFGLGTLGRNDYNSAPIRGFYKRSNCDRSKIFHIPDSQGGCTTCG